MIAQFEDVEIGSTIFFHVHPIERAIGGTGPPLGLTYTFNGGRRVPLVFDRVDGKQAYYKRFEQTENKEKREDMGRPKGSTNKKTSVMDALTTDIKRKPVLTAPASTKADPPKYIDMDMGAELWELDFPEKPELFRQLIQQRIDLKYEVDAMEERIKEINGSILPFFERNGIPGVKLENGCLVRRHEGQSATLDKSALVLAGVPADVIEKCTVRKKFTTVIVRGPKE